MASIQSQLQVIHEKIRQAALKAGRIPTSVQLLAVSKHHSVGEITQLVAAGQRCFGESYVTEALAKINALAAYDLEWHFIGPIQSNKTRDIAHHFAWVHSVDRDKIAKRLSEQRLSTLPPLQVCIQVNTSGETSKSGINPEKVLSLAATIQALPQLQLRGLMTIPSRDLEQSKLEFMQLNTLYHQLIEQQYPVDTLSMGMSNDLELAIACGATLVRVGSAIFGPREGK